MKYESDKKDGVYEVTGVHSKVTAASNTGQQGTEHYADLLRNAKSFGEKYLSFS